MKHTWRARIFIAAALTLTALSPALAQTAAPAKASPASAYKANVNASQLTRDQMERFLLNARIVGVRPTGKGVTHTTRITMTDGSWIHDAHVQTIDVYLPEYKTKEGIEKNFRDSYKFNIAAYRLDKIMDVGIVPVCVPREVDGKPAAID